MAPRYTFGLAYQRCIPVGDVLLAQRHKLALLIATGGAHVNRTSAQEGPLPPAREEANRRPAGPNQMASSARLRKLASAPAESLQPLE